MAGKKMGPKASNWQRISSRKAKETVANRDVHESQQLDRSRIERPKTKGPRTVLAAVAGVLLALFLWVVLSTGGWLLGMATSSLPSISLGGPSYYAQEQLSTTKFCYQILDESGEPLDGAPCYATEAEAQDNPPAWVAEQAAEDSGSSAAAGTFLGSLLAFSWLKLLVSGLGGFALFGILYPLLMRNLDSQNLLHDTSDINQHVNDQHIALPDEIVRKFDWFPDVGAHSSVQPSSMISHVMMRNKGLKKVNLATRAEKDFTDEAAGIEYFEGEVLLGADGEEVYKTVPMIDEDFGQELFDASGLPRGKEFRRLFDPTKIEYNPDGSNRDKLGKYKTVADLVNDDWEFPEYEVQRPGGAYIVDTAPVNTMVLAITRAGKGQTYIEPMLDMWLREKRPNNMVINDPKGELLVKHYVRATMRGFQVVQFNLINDIKTDIYNPLGMAAEAAREGDKIKCALYVENIADVFFPTDGGEDPVWPNAANNAFKRAAYGLIDYYLEEERELRAHAQRTGMDPRVLENRLDAIWGKVTLYNCYQLFVQLTSRKLKNPTALLKDQVEKGEFGDPSGADFDTEAYEAAKEEADRRAVMWEDNPELDMLTLFFNATEELPSNSMRSLIADANNALRAMAGAEKMLASVYGIAITAMSFFTDPTIASLTSGTPSQNTDLGGLSFPRRMGVRFGMNYLKRENLVGAQAQWQAFSDPGFTQSLGKDFYHDDMVTRVGWARYYFKGKFETDVAYIRLRLVDAQTGMLIKTFYFEFTKDYQTSLNGRHYVTDPIKGSKIVKNGLMVEMVPDKGEEGSFTKGSVTYPHQRLVNVSAVPEVEEGETNAIIQTMVRYSESPKAVFLVTPPHLMKYAKLILILVKQLVDLNFDKSYMTKADQKPLYKTRFMLDELGNLQSEGHGISGFETMLSIGLGQEQQFTLILQTLQQLRDVYGESVDKIVQGNAQPLDAKVATPTGWTTMGEIASGTEVLVPAGGSAPIDGVFDRGTRPVYKVTRADGSSTKACNEHLWEVWIED